MVACRDIFSRPASPLHLLFHYNLRYTRYTQKSKKSWLAFAHHGANKKTIIVYEQHAQYSWQGVNFENFISSLSVYADGIYCWAKHTSVFGRTLGGGYCFFLIDDDIVSFDLRFSPSTYFGVVHAFGLWFFFVYSIYSFTWMRCMIPIESSYFVLA